MTMIPEEDPEVARHIVVRRGESTEVVPQATPTMIREVGTVKGELELLLTEKHIREALELIIPDVTAIKIILTLVTKDHRSLIRRTR